MNYKFAFGNSLSSSLQSTVLAIKAISNYTRQINHRSRIKLIKFVNSTVKCNVNFTDPITSPLPTTSMNVWRLWNDSNNFMQHKIKSDLVIFLLCIRKGIFEFWNFLFVLLPFSITLHSISMRHRKRLLNNIKKRGWRVLFILHWRYL